MNKEIQERLFELADNLLENKYKKGILLFWEVLEAVFLDSKANPEIYQMRYSELFLKMEMAQEYFSELGKEISEMVQEINDLYDLCRQEAADNE